jgi:sorbitol-specific phosphotransferase system component IIC
MAERERINGGAGKLERKYWLALVMYGVLAVLAWFTIGEGRVEVFGRLIEVRWIPVFVLATFAFRTVMAMQAERVRRK